MVQVLALVILLVLGAALYNKLTKPGTTVKRKTKSGDIIDISDAWIAMDNLPYRLKQTMLNDDEIKLYQLLTEIMASDYVICPRVRLADILTLPNNVENRQAYQARINDRAVDFVICSSRNLQPLLAVFTETEIEARKKQIRDGLVRKALEAAGMAWIAIKVNPLPMTESIIKQLQKEGISI